MALITLVILSLLSAFVAVQGADDTAPTNIFGYCSTVPVAHLPLCDGPAIEVTTPMWVVTATGEVLLHPGHIQMVSAPIPGNSTLTCFLGKPGTDGIPSCASQCNPTTGVCPPTAPGCFCEWTPARFYYVDTSSGAEVMLQNVTMMHQLPSALDQNWLAAPTLFYHDKILKYTCPGSCVITCRQRKVSDVINTVAKHGSIVLGTKFNLHGGATSCTLSSDSGMARVDFDVDAMDSCAIAQARCATCWITLGNWSCYSQVAQGVIIAVAVILGLIILLILPRLLKALYRALRLLTMPIWGPLRFLYRFPRTRAAGHLGRGFRKVGDTYSYFMSPSQQEAQVSPDPEEQDEDPYPSSRGKVTAQPGETIYGSGGNRFVIRNQVLFPIYVLALCCLLTPAVVQACENTGLIYTAFPTCTNYGGGKKNCTVSYELHVTVHAVGSSSCLDIRDDEGFAIGSMEIKLNRVRHVVSLIPLYFTADYFVPFLSRDICWNNGNPTCPTNKEPCKYDYNAHPDVDGLIPQSYLNFPGETHCEIVTPGRIPLCYQYCRYSRQQVQPRGDPHEVLDIGSSWLEAEFTVNIILKDRDTVTEDFIIGGESHVVGDYKFDLQTSIRPQTDVPLKHKVIRNFVNGTAYYLPAQDRNVPVALALGEIQGDTAFNMTVKCRGNCFGYAPGLFDVRDKGLEVTYGPSAVSRLWSKQQQKFPVELGGRHYHLENAGNGTGQMVAADVHVEPFQIRVRTLQNVTFVREVDVVCPVATLVQASGCWSCQEGALVIVRARSTCHPGIVWLTVSGDNPVKLISTSLQLDTVAKEHTVRFLTGVQRNKFQLILSSNGHNASVSVQFTAVDQTALDNMTHYTQHGQSSGGGSGLDFGDLLDFLGSAGGSIADFFTHLNPFGGDFDLGWGTTFYVVVAVVLAVVILVLVLMCCPCCRTLKAAKAAKAAKKLV